MQNVRIQASSERINIKVLVSICFDPYRADGLQGELELLLGLGRGDLPFLRLRGYNVTLALWVPGV